jgi:type IV pilus assembly protein PilQ
LDKASEPLYTEIFKLFYTKPAAVKTILQGTFAAGADSASGGAAAGGAAAPAASSGGSSSGPQITIDDRMNSLIIKARKEDLEVIKKLIARVDSRTKQIFIEAFVVEVDNDYEKKIGARLGLSAQQSFNSLLRHNSSTQLSGVAGTSAATGLTAGDGTGSLVELPVASPMGGISFLAGIGNTADLKAELTAMQNEGITKVISNPRIFTLDNQEAVIFQGAEVPYSSVSDAGTQIQFKDAGLRLAVTPSVIGDGNLVMALKVNKDTVDSASPNPPITKSEVQTNLVTKDGSIVVIGGIYTQTKVDSTDKVPILGDIPVAKNLFRRTDDKDTKKELMIFIAPRVL